MCLNLDNKDEIECCTTSFGADRFENEGMYLNSNTKYLHL